MYKQIMCTYSNLYIISGKNAFPSKQFLPLGPLARALFVHLLLEAMRRMKMEAKAHENERRVQLIIIEKKRDLMRSVSLRVYNAFALYFKVTLGL